jgi:lysophospholipase L1-like esterase
MFMMLCTFVYQPLSFSTAEVLGYLTNSNATIKAQYRSWQFPIIINTGGTLNNLTGVLTGGTNAEWWFKDGTADVNLVLKQSGGSVVDTTSLSNRINKKYGLTDEQTYFGVLYNKATWSNLNDFYNDGSSAVIAGGAIALSGGDNTFTHGLYYNYYSLLPYVRQEIHIKSGPASSTSYGDALTLGTYYRAMVKLDETNTATSGKLTLYTGQDVLSATSTASLNFTPGDSLALSLERNQDTLVGTARNITTNSTPVTVSFVYTSLSTPNLYPHTGQYGIIHLGGNTQVGSWKIDSKTYKNATAVFLGDSKTAGFYASSPEQTFARQVGKRIPNTFNLGSPGENTQDLLNRISEVIALHPKQLFLAIGTNDFLQGEAPSVWQAHFASIVSQLQAAGIRVFILNALYDTQGGSNVIAAYVNATYPSSMVIHTYEAGLAIGATAVASDGVHLSPIGENAVVKAILNFNGIYGVVNTTELNHFTQAFIDNDAHINGNSFIGTQGAAVPVSSSHMVNLGSEYASTAGDVNAIKMMLFHDRVSGNRAGFGYSGNGTYHYTYGSNKVEFYNQTNGFLGSLEKNLVWNGFSVTNGVQVLNSSFRTLDALNLAWSNGGGDIESFGSTTGTSGTLSFNRAKNGDINLYGNTYLQNGKGLILGTGGISSTETYIYNYKPIAMVGTIGANPGLSSGKLLALINTSRGLSDNSVIDISQIGTNAAFRFYTPLLSFNNGDGAQVGSISSIGALNMNNKITAPNLYNRRTDLTSPPTPTTVGNTGDVYDDSTGHYICIATNTWRRILFDPSFQ